MKTSRRGISVIAPVEVIPPEETLSKLIVDYSTTKKVLDTTKKVVDGYNADIKKMMTDLNLPEFTVDDIKASISVTTKEDFNELQAIEILRKALAPEEFANIVKTKEYLDFDALEIATYGNKVDGAILAPCVTPKEPTITLRLGKAKK